MRTITPEQKRDPEFWKGNLDDLYPEIFFLNECLGTNFEPTEEQKIEIIVANNAEDFEKRDALRLALIKSFGVTDEQLADVSKKWQARNSYHNLMYYCIGICDREYEYKASKPNEKEPRSPFAVSGFNRITLTIASGTETVGYWDAIKAGLFKIGLLGEKSMLKLIDKVEKGKTFKGITWRFDTGWFWWEEGYLGYKDGSMGHAARPNQAKKK